MTGSRSPRASLYNIILRKKKFYAFFQKKNPAKVVGLFLVAAILLAAGYFIFQKFFQPAAVAEPAILRQVIHEPLRSRPQPSTEPSNLRQVIHGSAFSGVGWIDVASTTMYQDLNMSAMLFPPKVKWQKAESKYLNIELPKNNLGMVGRVVKSGDRYIGLISKADGTPILDEKNTPLVSKYDGVIAFGGDEDNFIAIYGAYEGRAVQVQGARSCGLRVVGCRLSLVDLSEFFRIRVMAGGFEPEILKTTLGGDTVWYVWNKSGYPAKLIKLFENRTGKIVGAVDLSPHLGFLPGDTRLITFNVAPPVVEKDFTRLTARVKSGKSEEFYEFTDFGFDKSEERMITSVNINQYPTAVYSAVFSPIYLVEEGAEIKFEASVDGKAWKEATFGEKIVFPEGSGGALYWRAFFKPDKDNFTSPFSTGIREDYAVFTP